MNEIQLIKAGWKCALTVHGSPTGPRQAAMIRLAVGNTQYIPRPLPGGLVAIYIRK